MCTFLFMFLWISHSLTFSQDEACGRRVKAAAGSSSCSSLQRSQQWKWSTGAKKKKRKIVGTTKKTMTFCQNNDQHFRPTATAMVTVMVTAMASMGTTPSSRTVKVKVMLKRQVNQPGTRKWFMWQLNIYSEKLLLDDGFCWIVELLNYKRGRCPPCFLRIKFTIHLSRLSRSQHLWCYVLSAMLLLRVFPGDHLIIWSSHQLHFIIGLDCCFFFSKKMLLDSENLVNFPTWQLQTNRCTAMPWSSFIFCNLHPLNHLQNSTQQSWTRWCGEIVAALKLSDWLACGWRTDLTFWINNLTNLGNLTGSQKWGVRFWLFWGCGPQIGWIHLGELGQGSNINYAPDSSHCWQPTLFDSQLMKSC